MGKSCGPLIFNCLGGYYYSLGHPNPHCKCLNDFPVFTFYPVTCMSIAKGNPLYEQKIIKLDLEAVINDSDYLIVRWDKSVLKGGGTHGEVTMAYWIKKPIFIVNSLPLDDMSSWIFSCSDFIFDDFDGLKKQLIKLYG